MRSDNVYCLWIADMQAGFISLHRRMYSDLWAAVFGCGTVARRLVIMIFCATSACVVLINGFSWTYTLFGLKSSPEK